MKINWTVRFKNKAFWLAFIPAILILVTQIAGVFGINLDFSALTQQLLSIVGTVFSILALLGIVVDPTTDGLGDSSLAMTYKTPSKVTLVEAPKRDN